MQITLEQEAPLQDLYIKWVGQSEGDIELTDEFDSETSPTEDNVIHLDIKHD